MWRTRHTAGPSADRQRDEARCQGGPRDPERRALVGALAGGHQLEGPSYVGRVHHGPSIPAREPPVVARADDSGSSGWRTLERLDGPDDVRLAVLVGAQRQRAAG